MKPLSRASVTGGVGHASLTSPKDAMRAMFAVVTVHCAAFFWLFYQPAAPASQQPVLSFTVTMMDLSSSPNTISSAASVASVKEKKTEQKKTRTEIKPDLRSIKIQPLVKPNANPTPKTNTPLSHSAQAQTAVLAPITPAQFDAAYLQNPAPAYPPLSRRMGEQGNILLGVYVSTQGKAETVTIRKSSGFNRLDSAAIEAVKRWRFIAAKQHEKLVASWVHVPIQFILE